MDITRTILAAASLLGIVSACSESEPDNQMAAPTSEAESLGNMLGMTNDLSTSNRDPEIQLPAPAAVAELPEPAPKAEPRATAPALKSRAEAPPAAPKMPSAAAANAAPKASAEKKSEATPTAPAAAPVCAPEHRALGHC